MNEILSLFEKAKTRVRLKYELKNVEINSYERHSAFQKTSVDSTIENLTLNQRLLTSSTIYRKLHFAVGEKEKKNDNF